jgi:hypothetical protein
VYKILCGFGWFSGCSDLFGSPKTTLDLQVIVADRSSDWNNDFAVMRLNREAKSTALWPPDGVAEFQATSALLHRESLPLRFGWVAPVPIKCLFFC